MAKIGYARVSTRSQNDDSQVDDLIAYGCDVSCGIQPGRDLSLRCPPPTAGGMADAARTAYREWADGQHRLHADTGIGLDCDGAAEAFELVH